MLLTLSSRPSYDLNPEARNPKGSIKPGAHDEVLPAGGEKWAIRARSGLQFPSHSHPISIQPVMDSPLGLPDEFDVS
jgi:hypothetical protein